MVRLGRLCDNPKSGLHTDTLHYPRLTPSPLTKGGLQGGSVKCQSTNQIEWLIKTWGWLLFLPLASPALAHTVKVSGDVAATFHIEPHHNPKAGKPSQAWFALTERGGKVIPLAQCNCKLAVHLNPHQEGDAPLLEPALKALSTEQYQGIPSAEITFPKVGAYELEISGTPKAGAKFQPFELSYEVTVAAGAMASDAPAQPKQSTLQSEAPAVSPKIEETSPSGAFGWLTIATGVGAAALATTGYLLWRGKNPKK